MRYALVNGEKTEAAPKQHGICLECGSEVIARCGKFRKHHWAHKHKGKCHYSAKEPKTEWHIQWQDHFPKEWQEERCVDEQTGEIHIADIKTPHGLVIEFQHSPINDEERKSREGFYSSMIWVVDGTRSDKMCRRGKEFLEVLSCIHGGNCQTWHEIMNELKELHGMNNRKIKIFTYKNPENSLPKEWLSCRVPVFFDYREENDPRLVGIIPGKRKNRFALLTKQDFISDIKSGLFPFSLLEASLPPKDELHKARLLLRHEKEKERKRYPPIRRKFRF